MATKRKPEAIEGTAPDVVIITGLSGSGMSSATNAFEDLGYFCVDNMPLTLLPTFARLVQSRDDERGRIDRAALVISFREGQFLADFATQLRSLRRRGLTVSVLFFEASDEILARRFSETRRPHPAERGKGLHDAIRTERTAMKRVRALADEVIETSDYTVHSLRNVLLERFRPSSERGADARSGLELRPQIRSAARDGASVRRAASSESVLYLNLEAPDRRAIRGLSNT